MGLAVACFLGEVLTLPRGLTKKYFQPKGSQVQYNMFFDFVNEPVLMHRIYFEQICSLQGSEAENNCTKVVLLHWMKRDELNTFAFHGFGVWAKD